MKHAARRRVSWKGRNREASRGRPWAMIRKYWHAAEDWSATRAINAAINVADWRCTRRDPQLDALFMNDLKAYPLDLDWPVHHVLKGRLALFDEPIKGIGDSFFFLLMSGIRSIHVVRRCCWGFSFHNLIGRCLFGIEIAKLNWIAALSGELINRTPLVEYVAHAYGVYHWENY